MLIDEEGNAVDGGFLGEYFLLVVVIGVGDGLGRLGLLSLGLGLCLSLGLCLWLCLWLCLGLCLGLWLCLWLCLGLCLGLGLGRLSGSLNDLGLLGLGLLLLGLGNRNRSLNDLGLLGLGLLLLGLGNRNRSLLDLGLLGILARLLDLGSLVASGVDKVLDDVLVGGVALYSDRLLGARLAHLGLLDGLVPGDDVLLHDLGIGTGLRKNALVVSNLIVDGRHEMELGEDVLNELITEHTLGAQTLGESITKDEHLVVLGGKRGLAGRLGLDLLDRGVLDGSRGHGCGHFGSQLEVVKFIDQKNQKKTFNFIQKGCSKTEHSFLAKSLISRYVTHFSFR